MKQAVISSDRFDEITNNLVSGNISELIFNDYTHIDIAKFKSTYLYRFRLLDIMTLAARKSIKKSAIRYFSLTYIMGRLNRRVKMRRRNFSRK